METIAEYNGLRIPDWSLSYIVNGDDSGITPEDKKLVDDYFQQFQDEAEKAGGHYIFAVETNEADYKKAAEDLMEELQIEFLADDDDYSNKHYWQDRIEDLCELKSRRNQDKESYFTWNPEFGSACNVVDCTILIVK